MFEKNHAAKDLGLGEVAYHVRDAIWVVVEILIQVMVEKSRVVGSPSPAALFRINVGVKIR